MRDRVALWADLLATDRAAALRACDLIVASQPVRQRLLDRLERTEQSEWYHVSRADRHVPRLRLRFPRD